MAWRISTDEDIKDLEMAVGMSEAEADSTGWRGTNEGSKLAGNASLWTDGALEDDPEFGISGFDCLAAGYRSIDASYGNRSGYAFLWSSTEYDSSGAWRRYLGYTHTDVCRRDYDRAGGFSVRCVRDTTTGEDSDADGTIYTDDYAGNDGKTYDGIKIGYQVWITENLKETKYEDGTNVPRIIDDTEWENDTDGARCEYGNDPENGDIYGFLYNWYAVDNVKELANPSGEPNTAPNSPSNPSPADGATGIATDTTLSVDVSDPDGDSMDVSFYNAFDDSLIGTDTGVASGGTASIAWSGLTYGATYNWYAVADDGSDTTQSSTWSFTTSALTGTITLDGTGVENAIIIGYNETTDTYLGKTTTDVNGDYSFSDVGVADDIIHISVQYDDGTKYGRVKTIQLG